MKKDDDLKEIKEALEIIAHKVGMMQADREGQSATLYLMKDQQSVMNTKLDTLRKSLDEVKDIQENRVLPSVTNTEMTIGSYADRYKINQHNIERVDTRLTAVEDKLEIVPQEDLRVPHFTSKQ